MKKIKILLLFILLILSNFVYQKYFDKNNNLNNKIDIPIVEAVPVDKIVEVEVKEGSTYGKLIEEAGLNYEIGMDIYDCAKDKYDLANLRLGRFLEFIYDGDTNELKELCYQIDSEEELHVKIDSSASSTDSWKAEVIPIEYEVKIKKAGGEIESSMYQAALDNDIDIRAIMELADAFQWTIDFALDPRVGDKFNFVYEERFLENEYKMPGKVLAGKYINSGKEYYVYYFEESEENKGYFDEEGNSVQKMFLRAPVSFRYVSSGFTTGSRYVAAFNVSTGHRAIDYATAAGTPIRSVGDGTVVFAGWSSAGYGYLTKIRHNGTYTTNYAHQSRIAVKRGQKVKQGSVIGYVGSTGFSTGPHLHYEMVKNGAKVNPYYEVLPPGKPIKEENKERFLSEIEEYKKMLK